MKSTNALLAGILLVLVLIWAKIPADKDVYRTETTLLGPITLAQGQEVKISSDDVIQVDVTNEPLQIEAPNALPVEVQR